MIKLIIVESSITFHEGTWLTVEAVAWSTRLIARGGWFACGPLLKIAENLAMILMQHLGGRSLGTYMLKQPNGLIAFFSSVVDDFTVWDATPEEALAHGVEKWGRSEAQDELDKALMDVGLWKPYLTDDGLGRWRESLTTIAFQQGVKRLKERLEELGFGDFEVPQEALEAARAVESDMDHDSQAYQSRM